MALRLVEINISEQKLSSIKSALADTEHVEVAFQRLDEGRVLVRILIQTLRSEPILDHLRRNFSLDEGFRMTLIPVEGTIPNLIPDVGIDTRKIRQRGPARINRTELLTDLEGGIELDRIFQATVILSAIVAAVGLLRNDVAIIIGAMVIAPLLTPNMALALGTTLGDMKLLRRALTTNLAGVALTLVFSTALGTMFHPDLSLPSIGARTSVSLGDLVLALASGSAGALAFTTGVSASLVGVMVAVALMPPLVVCGMMLGSQQFGSAAGAGLLVAANVICVNMSAVITFTLQGIQPKTWWEAGKAKTSTRIAVFIWGLLLVSLIILLQFTDIFSSE